MHHVVCADMMHLSGVLISMELFPHSHTTDDNIDACGIGTLDYISDLVKALVGDNTVPSFWFVTETWTFLLHFRKASFTYVSSYSQYIKNEFLFVMYLTTLSVTLAI
jgi:hypothetical protein